MSEFDALFVGHLIGDFLFQTGWMAKNKATKWGPLLTHVVVYTIVVTLVGWVSGGISVWAIALIFVSHVLLDHQGFVGWWSRHIQGVNRASDAWVTIMADQVFHVIILAVAVVMTQHLHGVNLRYR